jgi:hypothetical protein
VSIIPKLSYYYQLTVDELGVVVHDGLDESLLEQVLDGNTSERAVDLHPVDEDRLADELVRRDLLHDLVVCYIHPPPQRVSIPKKEEKKRKDGSKDDDEYALGLSRTTALLDLSFTFPLDHFFFLAGLPAGFGGICVGAFK